MQGLRRTGKVVVAKASRGGRVVVEKSSPSVARAAPYTRKAAAVTRSAADSVRRGTGVTVVAAIPQVKAGATATGRALKKAAKASTPYAVATGSYVVDNPDKVVGAITAAAAVSATVAASPLVAPIVAGGTAITAGLKVLSDIRKDAKTKRSSVQEPDPIP